MLGTKRTRNVLVEYRAYFFADFISFGVYHIGEV